MTRISPQEGADRWSNRLSAAVPDVKTGISRVTVSPGQQAAAKFNKWQTNTIASASKWRQRVGSVQLSDWQQAATQGADRIATGASQKKGKYESFASQFYPYLDAGVSKVKAMDDTTPEARIQRAVAMMRYNAQFKRSG
jgi:hypothetical protein